MINIKLFIIIIAMVVNITIFTFLISINPVFAQSDITNQAMNNTSQLSNQTAGPQDQNQTISPEIQSLMTLDISELMDNLINAKEEVRNKNMEEALTSLTNVENQLLLLVPQPKFTNDFQKIKDSIVKGDLYKALDDISNIQTELLKAETEIFKSRLPTSQQTMQQQIDNDYVKEIIIFDIPLR